MNGWEIVASFAFGLLVNEMTDVSPWAARKLVRWAAYRWTVDPDIAAGYAEEWTAIIDERPGKLLKLLTAVQFSLGAARRAAPRAFTTARDALRARLRALSGDSDFLTKFQIANGFALLTAALGLAVALASYVMDGRRETWLVVIIGLMLLGLALAGLTVPGVRRLLSRGRSRR